MDGEVVFIVGGRVVNAEGIGGVSLYSTESYKVVSGGYLGLSSVLSYKVGNL